jgi:putative phosphoesterase
MGIRLITGEGGSLKIIVISDSHKDVPAVEKIIKRNDADVYMHLGDIEEDIEAARVKYPNRDIRNVSGNRDSSLTPTYRIIDAGSARVFCTHGHAYGVNDGLGRLTETAKRYNCNVILFGHSHRRYREHIDGIYYLNPGSCSCPRDGQNPSYGYVEITEERIITEIIDL